MNIRKEINSLSNTELRNFREALLALQSDTTAENYQFLAGLHGLPNPSNCAHHLPEFLPWHRLYLQNFEKALQHYNPTVTLPYWDWTSSKAISSGIPAILHEDTFTDTNGTVLQNPLASALVEFQDRRITRNPSSSAELQFLANQVTISKDQKIFYSPTADVDFTSALEMPHDWLHGWVSGDMGRVSYSAYDPIFWLHHCNIDRYWSEWQIENPDIILSDELLNRTLPIYSKTIRETIDFKALGYTYDSLQLLAQGEDFVALNKHSIFPKAIKQKKKRVALIVDGLRMTQQTFELRFFINKKNKDFSPNKNKKGFAGSIFLLGMEGAKNPRGFMGEFKRLIDLTKVLKDLNTTKISSVSVRGFDQNGNSVPLTKVSPQLKFKIKE